MQNKKRYFGLMDGFSMDFQFVALTEDLKISTSDERATEANGSFGDRRIVCVGQPERRSRIFAGSS